jgi:uncharacterized protein YbaR (Trm112 family)
MPLVKCPECSSDISERAFTCPRCGDPRLAAAHEPVHESVHEPANESGKSVLSKEKEAVVIQRVLAEETGCMEHETKKAKIWCCLDIMAGFVLISAGVWLLIYTRSSSLDFGFLNSFLGKSIDIKYICELSIAGLWGLAISALLHGVLWIRKVNRYYPILESLKTIKNRI